MYVVLRVLSVDQKEDIITLVYYFRLIPKYGVVATFVALLVLQKSCICSMHYMLEPMFPLSFEVALWFLFCVHRVQGQGSWWFGQY